MNCFSKKKEIANDTINKYIHQIQSINLNLINNLTIENRSKTIELNKINSKIKKIEANLNKIEEKPIEKEILKFFFYLFTVLAAFLLSSFGLSENIRDIYLDDGRTLYDFEEEDNSKSTKNFYVTLFGIFFTIILTILQFLSDTNRVWLFSLYIFIVIILTLLFIYFHNDIQEQSYKEKIQLTFKNIKRLIYKFFKSRNYCEICLNKCNKNEANIGYLNYPQKYLIGLVRFGHHKCLEDYFDEYKPGEGMCKVYNVEQYNLDKLNLPSIKELYNRDSLNLKATKKIAYVNYIFK